MKIVNAATGQTLAIKEDTVLLIFESDLERQRVGHHLLWFDEHGIGGLVVPLGVNPPTKEKQKEIVAKYLEDNPVCYG